MASPFEKLLNKALQKSTLENNLVTKEARKIISKGYPEKEILDILHRFENGLIDTAETAIIHDAIEDLTDEY